MLRFYAKNIEISRFFVFFVLGLILSFSIIGCGGGGGGGGTISTGGTIAGYSGGNSIPSPTPTSTSTPIDTPPSANKDSFAIFIGMSDYPGTINDLPYAYKDANDVYSRLSSSSVWKNGGFKVLSGAAATKSAIKAAIDEARSVLTENGVLMFFYSGHGTNSGTTGYIIPYNALTEAGGITVTNMISSNELTSYLNDFSTGIKKYVVIDSCRSGYFIDSKGVEDVYHRAKYIPMDTSDPDFDDTIFTKAVSSVANCYIMTSSKGTELSWESGYLQNGVFTYYLCQGMGLSNMIGPAEDNSDGFISAEELSAYVPSRVSAYISSNVSGYTQTPQSYDGVIGSLNVK